MLLFYSFFIILTYASISSQLFASCPRQSVHHVNFTFWDGPGRAGPGQARPGREDKEEEEELVANEGDRSVAEGNSK